MALASNAPMIFVLVPQRDLWRVKPPYFLAGIVAWSVIAVVLALGMEKIPKRAS